MTSATLGVGTIAAYQANRRSGMRATSAYHAATLPPPQYPLEGDDSTEFLDRDTGFRIIFTVESDYDTGPEEWLGTFSNDPTDAVENPDAMWRMDGGGRRVQGNWRMFGYFRPETTEAEHYAGLRRLKFGRSEARRLAREYVERDAALAFSYEAVCLICRVYSAGLEVGSSAVGDIVTTGQSYTEIWDCLTGMAGDIAAEALADARSEVCRLADVAACLECNGATV